MFLGEGGGNGRREKKRKVKRKKEEMEMEVREETQRAVKSSQALFSAFPKVHKILDTLSIWLAKNVLGFFSYE